MDDARMVVARDEVLGDGVRFERDNVEVMVRLTPNRVGRPARYSVVTRVRVGEDWYTDLLTSTTLGEALAYAALRFNDGR